MKFSIVIPVYNRPEEVEELLQSLCNQTYSNFEVLIIEDGSEKKCKQEVEKYSSVLNIKYFFKPNTGPGLSRNYGASHACGDIIVFFDSDCLIPPDYFSIVKDYLNNNKTDAYGGPDAAHISFTPVQKAISFSMTSFLTTGGIRGNKKSMEKFHPRSFNMGFTQEVFKQTNGFSEMRFGEDIDMSLRIMQAGFSTRLIAEAFVYHKRRTDLKKFFKQANNSGIARINLFKRHPKSLKIIHFFPAFFTMGTFAILLLSIFYPLAAVPIFLYILLLFFHSFSIYKNIKIALLSVAASFTQLFAYGLGFIRAFWQRIVLKRNEFHAFRNNFYK